MQGLIMKTAELWDGSVYMSVNIAVSEAEMNIYTSVQRLGLSTMSLHIFLL